MSDPKPDPLLTDDEVAERLRIGARTLEKWRGQGGGPRFIRVGRRPLYKSSDVDAWLERQARTSNGQGA
jgi:excisionase family DNA binding protein